MFHFKLVIIIVGIHNSVRVSQTLGLGLHTRVSVADYFRVRH